MKLKKMMVVVLMVLMSVRAWAAKADAAMSDNDGLCDLIREMQGVFGILRTLAFVGAGFMLAKYAWDAISKGKIGGKDDIIEGTKAVGIPMLIGIILLCSIGTLLGVLGSVSGAEMLGCVKEGW